MRKEALQDGQRDETAPAGWLNVRLGEVCEIKARQVSPRNREFSGLPHVSGENIIGGKCQLTATRTAAEDGMISGKYLFEPGDVLYSKIRPYLRKAVVAEFRGLCSADIYPIHVNRAVLDPCYTAWLLVSDRFTRYANEESARARMPKLNRDQLLSWSTPLPPLLEQKRIVGTLTKQMAAVERARAAATEQLKAAAALPASYLGNIFCGRAVASWLRIPLQEAGEIVSGITLGRKVWTDPTRKVPYLRVANVKDARLDLTDVYTIEVTDREIEKLRLRYGDILLTEGGDRDKLGRGMFWQDQLPLCVHQNHIFRVRLDQKRFCTAFVCAQIGSPYGKEYFLAHAKQTTGIATINQRVLGKFPLLYPPLAEQRRTAELLSKQIAAGNRVRAIVGEEVEAIDALPAALLRQAFGRP